jgi:ferredoxin
MERDSEIIESHLCCGCAVWAKVAPDAFELMDVGVEGLQLHAKTYVSLEQGRIQAMIGGIIGQTVSRYAPGPVQ